ncbi:AAA family ATPase [Bradyrhizobium sp. CCBAU 11361]|uniref:AAA family ATPase n=1 Tax=Bradyrhizobium sp. CCBAU 11361 TaxID=1630812 RepID=UPI00230650B3|nr:AAA family ATPase [Bradyrhizobium sp. CCBAU 11361]MDA9491962.1 protein kinase [Bradyrhizobium sp. CCBAU 11361]
MDSRFQVLWEDDARIFCRALRPDSEGGSRAVLAVLPKMKHASSGVFDRLAHEFALKDQLDGAWALRPFGLESAGGHPILLLEDPGGQPLEQLLGPPMDIGRFLRLAIGIAAALNKVHQRGLVHQDVKPSHILVNCEDGRIRFTGFGIASRLVRERRSPGPPEFIVGTLPYMAPEQTGWMNRSIDFRSDLYSLGVTLYQMLTGSLPFTAARSMEWVHCHIARKPVPPSERVSTVPAPISAIVLKLLAKSAEQRYQSASGLEHDLRRCLSEWESRHRVEEFALGRYDTPDRLLIPEKLYGRDREIHTLLAAFDRMIKSGAPELVLVSGYSGVGKSSVVNELHRRLVPSHGLFASGKFDQYKRDIPYSTLVEAFQSLVRSLLSKNDAELTGWRQALHDALGANGRLVADLIPELRLIMGEQPSVPELPPRQAQNRFHLVFRRFIGVFARTEHPLALFLDDLQWLDAATLDLLEDLLTRSDLQYLMLIGAYRDNEVTAAHPLRRRLEAIRNAGANLQQIILAPLAGGHISQLISDALRCDLKRAAPLAQLIYDKTAGNPFFVIQFLRALAEEGLVRFDHDAGCWCWDLDRIHLKDHTDNVVDLMIEKLSRLPASTLNTLQQLACLGNIAESTTLSIVLGRSEQQVHSDLWEAVRQELVEHQTGAYRFVHDRVQEAAYSLIADDQRAAVHLRIGRQLLAQTLREGREKAVFEIVNQLNRGAALMTSPDEREQLAELNLLAGKRAKRSTAYAPALKYLVDGARLLPEDCWKQQYELAFALNLLRAECEFLTGALAAAEQRLTMMAHRAANLVDLAAITCVRVPLYMTLAQSDRAVDVGLEYLQRVDISWSPHPSDEEVRREFEEMWRQLGSRPIEALIALPAMSDGTWCATMDVLAELLPPALFTDTNLHCLVIARMANVSLEHGNRGASCFAYVWLGMLLGPRFGDYQSGFRFGQLGVDLVENGGLLGFKARVYLGFGHVVAWTRHLRTAIPLVRTALGAAQETGDLSFANIARGALITHLLAGGEPLAEIQNEAEAALEFAQKTQFWLVADVIRAQLGLIRTLRGLTPEFGCFSDAELDESRFEEHLAGDPRLAYAAWRYWIRKLQARYYAADYASAVEAAAQAERLVSPSFLAYFEIAEYNFYRALTLAVCLDTAPADERSHYLQLLSEHKQQLDSWAHGCPQNFESRALLVQAELVRIEGRDLDAMRLYDRAIRSARENGFVQDEALASELAARFYTARGFETIAHAYLRDARYGYQRWRADGKVRQLERMYPHLREERSEPGPMSTIGAPVEHLDLATVIKMSEAVSGEIVLEKLVDTLMRTAIEQAGADRGLLILSHDTEPRIEAEATTRGDRVVVELQEARVSADLLPESVLHYVLRAREYAVVDDAAVEPPFAKDPYVNQRKARSILCLPLINHGKLIGVLYLENTLTPHVFAPARIAVLKLLASQAAIALENATLYRDVREREAKIRRLVDANIIGIIIWELEGPILEANDAFLRIVGYDREDLASGRLLWTDLTPPEWLDRHERWWIPELKKMGSVQPFEKEYFRKDGSRVPVLIGMAAFDEQRDQGVSFVVDLTERKRSEEALRESEERFRTLVQFSFDVYWESDARHRFIRQEFAEGLVDAPASVSEIGKTRWEVPYLEPDEEAWRRHREALDAHLPFRDFELARPTTDGGKRYVSVSGLPVFDKSGHFVGYRGVGRHITEQKRATEALREMQRELALANRLATMGELTASIAHEVSQPIAAASMNAGAAARFLDRNPPDLERVRQSLGWLMNDTARASDIIQRIRDLIKKAPPRKDNLDINEAIRDVIELTRGEAMKNGVSVQTELADSLPLVEGDRVQLQQVVLNLIVNAVQAVGTVADDVRRVLITTGEVGPDRVLVEVQDSGPGLAVENLEHVFTPFYTTKPGGLGVGLSICRSIIEAHAGRLWVTPNLPRGATFHFTVPVRPADAS